MSGDGVSVEPDDAKSIWHLECEDCDYRKQASMRETIVDLGIRHGRWFEGHTPKPRKKRVELFSGSTVAAAIQEADSLEELEEVFNDR